MMDTPASVPPARRQLSNRDRIAGLLLLGGIVALLVYLRNPTEPSPVADLFLPPAAPLADRWLERIPTTAEWSEARQAYASGEYARAAEHLEELSAGAQGDLARLILASSHLLLGRAREAELGLRLALRSEDAEIVDEARWQLALLLLHEEDLDAARPELEKLSRGEGPHADLAHALLAQLGSNSSRMR